jgi:hypothetical protein
MKPIQAKDLLDLTAYEKTRDDFVKKTIALKKPRRIRVGQILCFIFENRDTVLFQIQEMIRAERKVEDEQIAEELRVYNELIPAPHGLSATLMIEIPDAVQIRPQLDKLVGIDEHVFLDVGDQTLPATFDTRQFEEDRISAVQYIRFPLGPKAAEAFCDPSIPAVLRVDHPNYSEKTLIEGASRASLVADLASD